MNRFRERLGWLLAAIGANYSRKEFLSPVFLGER